MRRIVILLAIVLVLAIFAGCLFLAFGNFRRPVHSGRKGIARCPLPEVTGCRRRRGGARVVNAAARGLSRDAGGGARRGAADPGRLSQRPAGPRRVSRRHAAWRWRTPSRRRCTPTWPRMTTAPAGAAHAGAAAVGDAPVLPLSAQRRRARRRPDLRPRRAAARPAAAEDPRRGRGRAADRHGGRLAGRGGSAAALHPRAALRDRPASFRAGDAGRSPRRSATRASSWCAARAARSGSCR